MLDLLRANPAAPFQQLVEHFTKGGWLVEQEADAQIVHLGFDGEPHGFRYAAAIKGKPPVILFFSIFPMTIPADKLPAFAEFCARANFQLTLGRFEMAWEERQLRVQSGVPLSNGSIDEEILQTVVRLNAFAANFYFNAVDLILKFDTSPQEALRSVEQGHRLAENQNDS